jgi:hypothetical protein
LHAATACPRRFRVGGEARVARRKICTQERRRRDDAGGKRQGQLRRLGPASGWGQLVLTAEGKRHRRQDCKFGLLKMRLRRAEHKSPSAQEPMQAPDRHAASLGVKEISTFRQKTPEGSPARNGARQFSHRNSTPSRNCHGPATTRQRWRHCLHRSASVEPRNDGQTSASSDSAHVGSQDAK